MAFLLNTHLNSKKKLYIALQKIYGLGLYQSIQLCDELGISGEKHVKQLTVTEFEKLTHIITQNYDVGLEIQRNTIQNVQRLVKIGCYKGFRHIEGLPVRGQRTHGNCRTRRKLNVLARTLKNK
jgi:small subunit ribosomal protein S13